MNNDAVDDGGEEGEDGVEDPQDGEPAPSLTD